MALLKGITVNLHQRIRTGKDAFNRDIYEDTVIPVENVLVSPISQTNTDLISELSMSGKKARYILAIPKEDNHSWEDTVVEFWGEEWKTTGFSTQGIEALTPLDWNRKIVVERYG